jgi:hypothetical protein
MPNTFTDAGNLRVHLVNIGGKISGKQKKFSSNHYFRIKHCKTFEQTTKKHKRVSINHASNPGKRILTSLIFKLESYFTRQSVERLKYGFIHAFMNLLLLTPFSAR